MSPSEQFVSSFLQCWAFGFCFSIIFHVIGAATVGAVGWMSELSGKS